MDRHSCSTPRHSTLGTLAAVVVIAAIGIPTSPDAAPFTWRGTYSDSWSNPRNWAESGGPDTDASVIINNGDTVRMNLPSASIGALSLGGSLSSNLSVESGNTLTISGAATSRVGTTSVLTAQTGATLRLNSRFFLGGASELNGDGSITNQGEVTLTGVSKITGTTEITNRGSLTMTSSSEFAGGRLTHDSTQNMIMSGSSKMTGGRLTNTQTVELQGAADIAGGTVYNQNTLLLTDSSTASNGIINNSGTLRRVVGGASSIGARVQNTGDIINEGELTFNGTGSLSGVGLTTNTGTLSFDDSSQLAGRRLLNSGGTLNLRGNALMTGGRTTEIANNGTMQVLDNAQLTSGRITHNGAALQFFDNSELSGTSINNSRFVEFHDNSRLSGGSVSNALGRTTRFLGGSGMTGGSISSAGGITFQDSAFISGGSIGTNLVMTVQGNAEISGGLITNGGLFNDVGQLYLADNAVMSGGKIINDNDGLLRLSGQAIVSGGEIQNSGTLQLYNSAAVTGGEITNQTGGRIERVTADATLLGGTIINQGVIDGDVGGLTLTGNVSGAGSYEGLVTFDGNFRPGNSPAMVTAETANFGASSALFLEVGGLTRGSEYDAINAIDVTLDGLLDIALLDLGNSFVPMLGDTFDLIIASQITGNFSSFSFAALSGGLAFSTNLITSGANMIYQLTVIQGQAQSGVPGPGAIIILIVGLIGLQITRQTQRPNQT